MGHRYYLLQIVSPQGDVIRFPAGGPLERILVDRLSAELLRRGAADVTQVLVRGAWSNKWTAWWPWCTKQRVHLALQSVFNAAEMQDLVADSLDAVILDLKQDSVFTTI